MTTRKQKQLPVPKWLSRRVELWQRRCELENWQIKLLMWDDLGMDGDATIVAEASWARGYHNGIIHWSRVMYDRLSERELDWKICHELFHLMAAPQIDIWSRKSYRFNEEHERLAERFASVMMRSYRRKPE